MFDIVPEPATNDVVCPPTFAVTLQKAPIPELRVTAVTLIIRAAVGTSLGHVQVPVQSWSAPPDALALKIAAPPVPLANIRVPPLDGREPESLKPVG